MKKCCFFLIQTNDIIGNIESSLCHETLTQKHNRLLRSHTNCSTLALIIIDFYWISFPPQFTHFAVYENAHIQTGAKQNRT